MNDRKQTKVSELQAEIRALEDELEEAIRSHEVDFFYRLDGTRVRFEGAVRDAHRKVRVGILRWLGNSSFRNVVSAPFIYSMILPFAALDPHRRYARFADFGDAKGCPEHVARMRARLREGSG